GVATMGGKWGIIDAEGTEVCAPRFDMLTGFSDGIASGTEQGCAVIVDRAGEVRWRGPQGASLLPPGRGRAWLHSGPIEGHHLLDTPSMEVIAERPDVVDAAIFANGRAPINVGGQKVYGQAKGGLWGFVDRSGQTVIEPQFLDTWGYE